MTGPFFLEEGEDLTAFRRRVAEEAGVPLSAVKSVTVRCPSCAADPVKGPLQARLYAEGFFAAVWID